MEEHYQPLKKVKESFLVSTLHTKLPFVFPLNRWDKKLEGTLEEANKYVCQVCNQRRDDGMGDQLNVLLDQRVNALGEVLYTFGVLTASDSLAAKSGDYSYDGYNHVKITPKLQLGDK